MVRDAMISPHLGKDCLANGLSQRVGDAKFASWALPRHILGTTRNLLHLWSSDRSRNPPFGCCVLLGFSSSVLGFTV